MTVSAMEAAGAAEPVEGTEDGDDPEGPGRPGTAAAAHASWRPVVGHALFGLAAAGVAGWAGVQQFWNLAVTPVQLDEWTYTEAGRRYLAGEVGPTPAVTHLVSRTNFEHPPLAKYLFGLAELVPGEHSVLAGRVVAATAALLCAALLALWLGRAAGRWCGLAAGGLLALVPMGVEDGGGLRFLRFAMLEPAAMLFGVAAVAAVWVWAGRPVERGWVPAAAVGVLAGLASGAKENGGLAVVGPVLVVLALTGLRAQSAQSARSARSARTAGSAGSAGSAQTARSAGLRRLAQAGVATAAAAVTFVALYLPLGRPAERIGYLLAWQSQHSAGGHTVPVADRLTAHPPWWANLWFTEQGYGLPLTVALAAAVAAALLLRRDLVTVLLASSAAGLLIFHCAVAGVALPFYWVIWQPQLLGLAALGLAALARRARRPRIGPAVGGPLRAVRRLQPAALVAALLAVLSVAGAASAAETGAVLSARSGGVAALPGLLAGQGLRGPALATGLTTWDLAPYAPDLTVHYGAPPAGPAGYALILLGPPRCGRWRDAELLALVAANLPGGRLRVAYDDPGLSVYEVMDWLVRPTPAEVAAAREHRTSHC